MLKIAHEQLSLQPEENTNNAICSICKKDMAVQNNDSQQAAMQEEVELSLNF